jgi:transposase
VRVALARAVHARRGGWPAAREDPKARPAAVAAGAGRARGRADAHRAARRGDALDRPGNGDGRWRVAALGAADLGGAPPAAHRVRRFKLSQDPAFAAKLRDVVGLYLDPPAHSLVLSVDEKSQIQALDRTQPGLPIKKGRAGTMTHDYIRHGTTTLFAALNVLDGTVTGQCVARHRHQEFIRFLNRIEAVVPAGKLIHPILDNYAAQKHPKVRAWLARHPRWTFHFTPTSCSWANAVETFFASLTRRRLQRGAFHSLIDLQATINRYLGEHIANPNPSSGPPIPTASSRRSIVGIK